MDGHPAAAGLRVGGFEALARWRHPGRGLVPPDQFIPVAEECGLISALGDTILRQALPQLARWRDRSLTMSVNVSVRQLVRPGFSAEVITQLDEMGIDRPGCAWRSPSRR